MFQNEVPLRLDQIEDELKKRLGLGSSFDVCFREMRFGDRKAAFLYINGFLKDEVLTLVIDRLTELSADEIEPNALEAFLKQFVIHSQVEVVDQFGEAIDQVLAGSCALFIDGAPYALMIDAKNFPTRSPEEPELERVVRGSRDGFVESLLTNVSLVRRRIRDPELMLDLKQIGRRTKTDICIAYIQDIADPELIKSLHGKLQKVDIDGITLADKQLEEAIIGKGWSPFPLVRYSERPDVVAAHLLEGHVILFVDTSPSVMILPTTFFHLIQHAEENRQTPFIGTYLRWVRFLGIFVSLFLLPVWFLYSIEPNIRPEFLEFIGPEEDSKLPLIVQFLLVEIGVDLMRLAAVHTPTPLATAMGLIAAILIGDIAINVGLFVNEVVLYMAVAATGMFATPNYELSMANRIVRIMLLILVAIFKAPGLIIGTTLVLISLIVRRSYNTPYMWPLVPFDGGAMREILIRRPFLTQKYRPSITKPQDSTRQPT